MDNKLKTIKEKCAIFREKQREFMYGKEVAMERAATAKAALEDLLWEIEAPCPTANGR